MNLLEKKWPAGGGRSSSGSSKPKGSSGRVSIGHLARGLSGRQGIAPIDRYLRVQQASAGKQMVAHIRSLQRQRGITLRSPRQRIAEAIVQHANSGQTPGNWRNATARYYGFNNHAHAENVAAAVPTTNAEPGAVASPAPKPDLTIKSERIFLKALPQYNGITKAKGKAALLNSFLPKAHAAAMGLVDDLGKLPAKDRVAVAKALIKHLQEHLASVSKAGPPDEPRDNTGKWTVGGAVSAGASLAGRGALALGGLTLRGIRDALSTVTLVPSSKTTAMEALGRWWARARDPNENVRSEANVEAMGRVLGTIFVAIGVYAVAQYYVPIALNSVGMAASRAIGHALNFGVP